MSKPTSNTDRRDPLSLESGLEALQSSPEFRGPVEPLDGHHSNDHLALVYEDRAEQFAAAVPFIRQGLERGERCLYVADENSKDEVLAAMRARGMDVDAARESGALTLHTKQDTYCRDGGFDPDEMIDFLVDSIEEAVEDGEYEALRITGEMTWIFGDDPDIEDLVEYEGKLNRLFPDKDCIALCQYNRERFPPEIVRDVLKTHPHLVYDSTVCQNFYYTPPEEFFGPERPEREIDRMMNVLLERTEAKTKLQQRQQLLHEQNTITADPTRTFEEKLQALFELGCEQFGLELGAVAQVDAETDQFLVKHVSDEHEHFEPGLELPLSETYCVEAVENGGATSIAAAGEGEGESEYEDVHVCREFGIRSYLGTYVPVEGGHDRTFFFVSSESRDGGFSDDERNFQQLMGEWVKHELERRQREVRLAGLNTLAREVMDAKTARDVSDAVVERAEESLNLPVVSIALYDDQRGSLRPTAETDAAAGLLDTASLCEVGEGVAWDAFVQQERHRVDDPPEELGGAVDASLTELAAFPLDNHGVVLAGSTSTEGFSSTDLDFAGAVAANVSAALGRADREQRLQERESVLQSKNETLERLSRVNDIIRSIDQALVQASSRHEIEEVVCEELTASGHYELAWIGEHDPLAREVTPKEWAGAEKGYLDDLTISLDDSSESRGPTGRAVETGEPQVVNDILDDAQYEPWRQDALNRGYHASIALPLGYGDSLYGVLNVYGGQPGIFGGLEQAVLTELADTIAYAINAVESKKALVSDKLTELEFTVTDSNFTLVALTEEFGGAARLESVVPRAEGDFRAFVTTQGIPAEDVLEFSSWGVIKDAKLTASREESRSCLFEFVLGEESLGVTVLKHGGRPDEIAVEDGVATVTLHLAADANTRQFVDVFQTRYPDSRLDAQRSRERSTQTATGFLAELGEELTTRQREVLQTAYFSGFFEQPRVRTGTEIADAMGISQPTFNSHLRAAQLKLCRQLFESQTGAPHPDSI